MMKNRKIYLVYLVRNTFNGNYLLGAERDDWFNEDARYWTGYIQKAYRFESKDLAEEIAGSINFGDIETYYG